MKLFVFLSYICIQTIAIFCSYCQEFTIKSGAFKFIDGNTLYNNTNNIKVKKGTIFLTYILPQLKYKKIEGYAGLSSDDVVKKISKILGDNGFFLAKDRGTGKLSIVGVQDGFQEYHANCEFIIRDNFFDLGAISYESWNYIIDKDYKRNFLEIVLKYANGDFENWQDFSNTLKNFIKEVLNANKLTVQNNFTEKLSMMKNFVVKKDKFSFDLFCDCRGFSHSGAKHIIDIKNFLTEVDRKNFVGGDFYDAYYLVIYISDRYLNELSFHSSDQDYALKPVSQNIYICNFFEYDKTLDSDGIHKLLKGNGYDIFQNAELSFGKYLSDINVTTKNLEYVDKRPKSKLNFTYDNNIFKYVDENAKILEKEEIYLDELDQELKYCKGSLEYDKNNFRDGGTFEIKIVKPIARKVEYVKKNVGFELDWNLKGIYGLKIDEDNVKREFQINATSTLKSVLGEFFKELNKSLGIADNYCPDYDVFNGEAKIPDHENYKILKDENFTIKLDIFDDKYFEKKDCTRNLKIQIKDYKEVKEDDIAYIKVPKVKEFETSFVEDNNRNLLMEMLKAELQKEVFTNSKDIEFEDFSSNDNVVTLSIKNLAEDDIIEIKFVTSIRTEAPKYFKKKDHISYSDCYINKDSTLEDAIKNIGEEIKKELRFSNAPVFDYIKYNNSDFSIIDNKSKITPCKEITLKFKSGENLNEEYIFEDFPVEKAVNIFLKQDNNYFALKKNVEKIIKEISSVKLHEDATYKNFSDKVAKELKDKTKAENPPVLSFKKNKINLNDSINIVPSDDLYLYLDPFTSGEYVEKNKDFEGVILRFELKCNIANYKLKNDYNNKEIYLAVKDINNGKVKFEDLKKAIEENYKIQPNQCKIYDNENNEFKDEDIINDKNFVVEITDTSLVDYLTPLKEMTFTIDYKYEENVYKLNSDAPKELTVLITEEDLNKDIRNFISDHIITTIEEKYKVKSYSIFPDSLNNNKVSDNPDTEVNGCINESEKNIIVLQLSSECNLLESKEKPVEGPERKPKEKPGGEPKEKSEETTQKGEGGKTCCNKCCKPRNDKSSNGESNNDKSTEKKRYCNRG